MSGRGSARDWLLDLERTREAASTPRLIRDGKGVVYVSEAGRRRRVPSGLVAAALADRYGDPDEVDATAIDTVPMGPPVEVFQDSKSVPFVVVGGRRLDLRGLPVARPVDDADAAPFPAGVELDVAHANVPRRKFEAATSRPALSWRVRQAVSDAGGVVPATKRFLRRRLGGNRPS